MRIVALFQPQRHQLGNPVEQFQLSSLEPQQLKSWGLELLDTPAASSNTIPTSGFFLCHHQALPLYSTASRSSTMVKPLVFQFTVCPAPQCNLPTEHSRFLELAVERVEQVPGAPDLVFTRRIVDRVNLSAVARYAQVMGVSDSLPEREAGLSDDDYAVQIVSSDGLLATLYTLLCGVCPSPHPSWDRPFHAASSHYSTSSLISEPVSGSHSSTMGFSTPLYDHPSNSSAHLPLWPCVQYEIISGSLRCHFCHRVFPIEDKILHMIYEDSPSDSDEAGSGPELDADPEAESSA